MMWRYTVFCLAVSTWSPLSRLHPVGVAELLGIAFAHEKTNTEMIAVNSFASNQGMRLMRKAIYVEL